jgi:transposase
MAHGHNKVHRPDLKQLVFGLSVTSDGAVPLLHNTASGNGTDDTLHRGNFDRLRVLLGGADFIYVADSKLATTENMAHLARYGGRFVTVLPRTRKEDSEFRARLIAGGVRWRAVVKIPSHARKDEPPDVFSCPVGKEGLTREGYRLTWYRISGKARIDADARKRNLKKASVELDEFALKLETPRKNPISRREVVRKARAVCRRYGCEDFVKITLRENEIAVPRRFRAGRPRKDDPVRMEIKRSWSLPFEIDEGALSSARKADGVFPLVSHGLEKRSRGEILEIYKYQPYLEKRFSQIKTDLAISPVFLKTPIRAAALLDVYFIAIAVSSLMERDIRKAMEEAGIARLPLFPEERETSAPTAQRVLEAFASVGWHEFQRGAETICFPLEMNDLQKKLLGLLGISVRDYG